MEVCILVDVEFLCEEIIQSLPAPLLRDKRRSAALESPWGPGLWHILHFLPLPALALWRESVLLGVGTGAEPVQALPPRALLSDGLTGVEPPGLSQMRLWGRSGGFADSEGLRSHLTQPQPSVSFPPPPGTVWY